ncbi:hypothetical protein GQ457_03G046090 [Hibiscus cannabinus]
MAKSFLFGDERPKGLYEDGVSEGQFYQVFLYELDAIRKACASLEPTYQIYYLALWWIPRSVIRQSLQAFHVVILFHVETGNGQGRSRPAHYHVLWDENNFAADEIQSLTNLCYMYARCTLSVSVGTCENGDMKVGIKVRSITFDFFYSEINLIRVLSPIHQYGLYSPISKVPPAYYAHLAVDRARFYIEPFASENGRTRCTRTTNGSLKEKLRNVMFCC